MNACAITIQSGDPLARNLHEDLLAVSGQSIAMQHGADSRRILHGRHENNTIHDENGMRHYYDEWGRYLNRNPSDPSLPYTETKESEPDRLQAVS